MARLARRTGKHMGMETKQKDSSCPISQMSFGDISRYLQGGFEPAVRKAVAAHVVYCNSCREELERIKALRTSGRHMMISNLGDSGEDDEPPNGDGHPEEVVLAAYIDDGLTGEQRNRVTEHIASCHDCYVRFSSLEKELAGTVPRPLRAPASVTEAMKLPVPSHSESLGVAGLGRQILDSVEGLLGLRWTQPALAFVAGVLVMLLFLPSSRTVVPLPGVSPVQTSFDDRVRSSVDGETTEVDAQPVILLPSEAGTIEFTWPGTDNLTDAVYRIEVFDSDGNQALETAELTENRWVVEVSTFTPGSRYDILISEIGRAGGVRPVSQQSLLVAE